MKLRQTSDGTLLRAHNPDVRAVNAVAMSPNGQMVAVASDETVVRLYRTTDGMFLKRFTGHTKQVNAVAFSPDHELLATASGDGTLKVWRIADGTLLNTMNSGIQTTLAFSRDGSQLISWGSNYLKFWSIPQGTLLHRHGNFVNYIIDIIPLPNGLVAIARSDGIYIIRADNALAVKKLNVAGAFTRAVLSPDEKLLVCSGSKVVTWRLSDYSVLQQIPIACSIAAISPDNQTLIASTANGISVWKVNPLVHLNTSYANTDKSLLMSPDGSLFVAGGQDGFAAWYVTMRGQPDVKIRTAGDTAFTGDNIYNVPTAQAVTQPTGANQTESYHLAVQNDGKQADSFFVTGMSGDSHWTVRYFDRETGGTDITAAMLGNGWQVGPLNPGEERIFRLEVTPDTAVPMSSACELDVTAVSAQIPAFFDTATAITQKVPLTGISVCTTPASPALAKNPVTLSVTPLGGNNIEYRFLAVRNGAQTELRSYGAANLYIWTPAEAGEYALRVYAREVGSTAPYTVSREVPFTVLPLLSAVRFTASPTQPQLPGKTVTLTVSCYRLNE